MKFLCVQCDTPMAITNRPHPDANGSLAARFQCPECHREIAMLTNAHETQLVTALGVKIGKDATQGKDSKCPFAAMLNQDTTTGTDRNPTWTTGALSRLENIPEFVRPMAKTGIEHFAKEKGIHTIDDEVLDAAKGHYNMT